MNTSRTSLLGAAALMAAMALPGHAVPGGDVEPFDLIPMYPVVAYDVSGTTLLGPVSQHLIVYSNGRVQYSQDGDEDSPDVVEVGSISPDQVDALLEALAAHDHLQDEFAVVVDIPLQTLTTIDNGEARSVSWWIGAEGHDELERILDRLTLQAFSVPD